MNINKLKEHTQLFIYLYTDEELQSFLDKMYSILSMIKDIEASENDKIELFDNLILKDIKSRGISLDESIDDYVNALLKDSEKNTKEKIYTLSRVISIYAKGLEGKEIEKILENNSDLEILIKTIDENERKQITDTCTNMIPFFEHFEEKREYQIDDISNDYPLDDSTKMYLDELAKIPLLTREERKEYARKAANGDEEAKKIMIESNLKLVVYVAKNYRYQEIPFIDLIQEGNLGLMKAVEMFDPEKGTEFSTYAMWWIRQSITRAIANKGHTIRKSVHFVEKRNKIDKIKRELEQELGRTPTIEELSKKANLTEKQLDEIDKNFQNMISLDLKIGVEKDTTIGEIVSDTKTMTPEEQVEIDSIKKELELVIDSLEPDERDIIRQRYGFDGDKKTFGEIGKELGITRAGVQQREAKIIKKLRKDRRIKSLDKNADEHEEVTIYIDRNLPLRSILSKFYNDEAIPYILENLLPSIVTTLKMYYGENLDKPFGSNNKDVYDLVEYYVRKIVSEDFRNNIEQIVGPNAIKNKTDKKQSYEKQEQLPKTITDLEIIKVPTNIKVNEISVSPVIELNKNQRNSNERVKRIKTIH